MRILSPTDAKYFCAGFTGNASSATGELEPLLGSLKWPRVIREGTSDFAAVRDYLLREAERSMLLAAAKRLAAVRGLTEATVPWTVVGLYYSSFFSAKALLAMHGGCVLKSAWLEIDDSTQGSMVLRISRKPHPAVANGRFGSHQRFWKIFYQAAQSIYAFAPATDVHALDPVNSSETWLIDSRNQLNYKTTEAFTLINDFASGFDATNVPSCFPGIINVFSNIASAMQAVTHFFRTDYALSSDVLSARFASLDAAVSQLIRPLPDPSLVAHAQAVAAAMQV